MMAQFEATFAGDPSSKLTAGDYRRFQIQFYSLRTEGAGMIGSWETTE
jgi:hypothetical protein